ncbi:unnamed protein product [Ambrosiozyma monospora]|uniref:Unnamed protein product n=1 Tax=Ambrosiozyma monospora TaxID=43982 RepID=A0ACB5TCN7_AMBMO|nr:unnamed protein product [Ambrosiozyma monospora]
MMQAITTPSSMNSGKLRVEKSRAREARKALDPSYDAVVFQSFNDLPKRAFGCEEEKPAYNVVPSSYELETGVEKSCDLPSSEPKSAFTTFIEDCGSFLFKSRF